MHIKYTVTKKNKYLESHGNTRGDLKNTIRNYKRKKLKQNCDEICLQNITIQHNILLQKTVLQVNATNHKKIYKDIAQIYSI